MDQNSLLKDLINKFLENDDDIIASLKEINLDLQEKYNMQEISWLQGNVFFSSYLQFEHWLNNLFYKEPFGQDIKALNFGLFVTDDNNIQIYISGSTKFDKNSNSWALVTAYFPEDRYPAITAFAKLGEIYEKNHWAATYLAITFTIIFLKIYINRCTSQIFKETHEELYLATGFDNGELFSIGRLTTTGLEQI